MNTLVYNRESFDSSMIETLTFLDGEIRDFTALGTKSAVTALKNVRRDYLTVAHYRR